MTGRREADPHPVRLLSLATPVPEEAVLARPVWSIGHGGAHPLAREGVPVTEALRTGLLRAGVASVWAEDAASEGIAPREPLSETVRVRASSALARMLRASARGGPGARVDERQLGELAEVVDAVAGEVRESSALVGVMTDLQSADGDTVSHSLNVAVIGMVLGRRSMRERGWEDWRGGTHRSEDRDRLSKLGLGLMLHDVGKALIPSRILAKPAALTDDELAVIREHPLLGIEMLEGSGISPLTRVVVADHHERMDGSGYPSGKTGDRIHGHARIAAIADTYDAAAARRAYAPDRTNQAAWELVGELGRAGLLDRELTGMFARSVAPYPEGTEVDLEDGRRALVARVGPDALDRPVLRVTAEEGGPVAPYELDLRVERDVRIRDVAERDGADPVSALAGELIAAA